MFKINQMTVATIPQEGLPFWLFLFLLGVIALLGLFIFLRNKDLRRKIDHFFHRAKNRSLENYLRRQIDREKKKKERLWYELGRTVYENNLIFKEIENLVKTVDSFERKKMEMLSRFTHSLKGSDDAFKSYSPELRARYAKGSVEDRTPQSWKNTFKTITRKKNQKEFEEKINSLERQINNFLVQLGRTADIYRPEEEKLVPLYKKINEVNLRLSQLEQKLDSLYPL